MEFNIKRYVTQLYIQTINLYSIRYAINQETTISKTMRSVNKRHGNPNIKLIIADSAH